MPGDNPWRILRSRSHLTLRWKRLPEGMGGVWSEGTITLDPRLGRVALRCALMHELVHDERRIGWPFATEATMEHEEAQVRRITARRLVPLDELEAMKIARDGIDYVTARTVAEEFDVTETVAALACRLLDQALLDRELARASRTASRTQPADGRREPHNPAA